jgi:hypothetical protein
MNFVMFNCDLNIHTCTWMVSLTIILKYLLNYGIKICQNVAYLLTLLGCPPGERWGTGVGLEIWSLRTDKGEREENDRWGQIEVAVDFTTRVECEF